MRQDTTADERLESFGEELASSISHGVGLIALFAGAPVLIVSAVRHGDASVVVGVSIFAASAALVYLASTLYHALPRSRAKEVFHFWDRAAIFVLIAGTYTPFTLGVLRGALGWTLFGLVWGIAAIGIVLQAAGKMTHPVLSVGLYVAMGWLAVVAIRPISLKLTTEGILWVFAGGLAYTLGIAFFGAKRLRFNHFVWHLFVIAGTTCHYFAVLWYSA